MPGRLQAAVATGRRAAVLLVHQYHDPVVRDARQHLQRFLAGPVDHDDHLQRNPGLGEHRAHGPLDRLLRLEAGNDDADLVHALDLMPGLCGTQCG